MNERLVGSEPPPEREYAEALEQLEPEDKDALRSHPLSLTAAELGRLPATMATEPIDVFAWVRYPSVAVHVQGLALAWTPRAVYVEWEHKGLHRAWVWASAVQRGGMAS
jgi:hypothetical protein